MHSCHFCGGERIEELTTFIYEQDGQMWVIRNVPAYVCKQCGEKEYSQEVTHKILALLKQPPSPTEMLHIPAYDLAVQ